MILLFTDFGLAGPYLGQVRAVLHGEAPNVPVIDLLADAPAFDPMAAAYLLGPERGSLSPEAQARCDLVVKIPTRFCVNVGTAGAIVMYDRLISLGRFARRPVNPRAPVEATPDHVQGAQKIRRPGPPQRPGLRIRPQSRPDPGTGHPARPSPDACRCRRAQLRAHGHDRVHPGGRRTR